MNHESPMTISNLDSDTYDY